MPILIDAGSRNCAQQRLVRFLSVGRGQTSATEPSMQLKLESGTIDGPYTARLVI